MTSVLYKKVSCNLELIIRIYYIGLYIGFVILWYDIEIAPGI